MAKEIPCRKIKFELITKEETIVVYEFDRVFIVKTWQHELLAVRFLQSAIRVGLLILYSAFPRARIDASRLFFFSPRARNTRRKINVFVSQDQTKDWKTSVITRMRRSFDEGVVVKIYDENDQSAVQENTRAASASDNSIEISSTSGTIASFGGVDRFLVCSRRRELFPRSCEKRRPGSGGSYRLEPRRRRGELTTPLGCDLGSSIDQQRETLMPMTEEEVREIAGESYLRTARAILGDEAKIDVIWGDKSRHLPGVFLVFLVVEVVGCPARELALDALERHGIDAELGEELAFSLFRASEEGPLRAEPWAPLFSLPDGWDQFPLLAASRAKQDLLAAIRARENPANDSTEL